MIERFRNRSEAGVWLAKKMGFLTSKPDLVLALPRGGVPVALEVSSYLQLPLEVFVVRKLGVPGHEEYAMGAIASGGVTFLSEEIIQQLGISSQAVAQVIRRETNELERRDKIYSSGRPKHPLNGKCVVLVDDGLATGATMKVAVEAVKKQGAYKAIVAVPVAPASAREEFASIADEFICVLEPELFFAVGQWYDDFSQTTDDEVRELLAREPVH